MIWRRVRKPAFLFSLSRAASAKPAFLFSLKVDLRSPRRADEYFGNILTIIGNSGRAIITCKWSAGKSFQFARQSWAHAQELLSETVARIGGRLVALSGEDQSTRTSMLWLRSGRWRSVRELTPITLPTAPVPQCALLGLFLRGDAGGPSRGRVVAGPIRGYL